MAGTLHKNKNNATAQVISRPVIANKRMWRLVYLFLLFVRVYFALSPSYLHPDEIFQGPEPVAGMASSNIGHTAQWLTFVPRIPLPLPKPSYMGVDSFETHP